ncbi:MAG: J domain-containing protein [Salinisphaeraceae bacterium]
MDMEAYPLQWPHDLGLPRTAPADREHGRFGKEARHLYGRRKLTVAEARSRVIDEVKRLTGGGRDWRPDAATMVISTNIRTRADGLPYSNAREPDDPGVAVYFCLDGDWHCLPCDKWRRAADNLAAIAKTIEADRGKARWGVVDVRRAYKFAALPSPESAGGTPWHVVLGCEPDAAAAEVKQAYRRAAFRTHPDRPDGSAEGFDQVQRAWEQARRQVGL